ncbi:hypothetical protein [Halobacterium sp. BOL4-2]|uniref:hypothetical protein n=1 Tax=Halobacterium sp. BOL4-2 TaxID=2810537 RepID=UPI001E5699FB|nr:hypothetical protein [Halobacterium sp. BOL4-2]UDF60523.1 hypothetical protein JRZ79_13405 [Halobacterium sp. BOL4-2]
MPAERSDCMRPSDDVVLGILNLGGGSGTSKSIQSTYESDANKRQVLRDVSDDAQNVELSTIDITQRLWILHDLGLVEYLGHGEFRITDQGRAYYNDEGVVELPSIKTGWRRKLGRVVARRGKGVVISILSVIGLIFFLRASITNVCELGLGTSLIAFVILPITLALVVLHLIDMAKPLNIFLINTLSIVESNGLGDGEVSSEDIDASAAAISNSFRSYTVLGLCVLLGAGTLLATQFTLNTQVYGLIFDLFGGVFLGFQAIHASRGQLRSSGKDLALFDFGSETVEVTDGIWGIFFLIIGFGIQGLAQIPWGTVLHTLFGNVPSIC